MNIIRVCFAIVCLMMLAACINLPLPKSHQEKYLGCNEETTVVIYDNAGAYEVPGCISYETMIPAQNDAVPEEIEGEFPQVPNNKYYPEQVAMQNLKTRMLAYCRGTEAAIEACVERLECSGFTRITDVPQVAAKYDLLKQGTYPTRRWREGEAVPRW